MCGCAFGPEALSSALTHAFWLAVAGWRASGGATVAGCDWPRDSTSRVLSCQLRVNSVTACPSACGAACLCCQLSLYFIFSLGTAAGGCCSRVLRACFAASPAAAAPLSSCYAASGPCAATCNYSLLLLLLRAQWSGFIRRTYRVISSLLATAERRRCSAAAQLPPASFQLKRAPPHKITCCSVQVVCFSASAVLRDSANREC